MPVLCVLVSLWFPSSGLYEKKLKHLETKIAGLNEI